MSDILIGLAVWRVSLMLVHERGLFGVFTRLRVFIGAETNDASQIGKPSNELGQLFLCVWCMSIWVGAIAAYLAHRPIWVIMVYSAVAVLAQSYVDRN